MWTLRTFFKKTSLAIQRTNWWLPEAQGYVGDGVEEMGKVGQKVKSIIFLKSFTLSTLTHL